MLFYGAMHAGEGLSPEAGAWFVEPDRAGAPLRARRFSGALWDEGRAATSVRAVIASSVFLAVLASAFLLGGHAAIDPLLQSALAAREAKGVGEVVLAMPDGMYCRYLSFDNMTAEVAEAAVKLCPPSDVARERARSIKGFAWLGR